MSINLCLVGGLDPLKNISQLGSLFPIDGKIKHVPKHQPDVLSDQRNQQLSACSPGAQCVARASLASPATGAKRAKLEALDKLDSWILELVGGFNPSEKLIMI